MVFGFWVKLPGRLGLKLEPLTPLLHFFCSAKELCSRVPELFATADTKAGLAAKGLVSRFGIILSSFGLDLKEARFMKDYT